MCQADVFVIIMLVWPAAGCCTLGFIHDVSVWQLVRIAKMVVLSSCLTAIQLACICKYAAACCVRILHVKCTID